MAYIFALIICTGLGFCGGVLLGVYDSKRTYKIPKEIGNAEELRDYILNGNDCT